MGFKAAEVRPKGLRRPKRRAGRRAGVNAESLHEIALRIHGPGRDPSCLGTTQPAASSIPCKHASQAQRFSADPAYLSAYLLVLADIRATHERQEPGPSNRQ